MKISNIKFRLLKKKIKLIMLAITGTVSLTAVGCSEIEFSNNNNNNIDVFDTNDNATLESGIIQKIKVDEENFRLIIKYTCDNLEDGKWRITANKNLYMTISTEGLSSDTKVFIDNIHVDTSILATNQEINGIQQDTLDDHIHNSLMYGFPISDTITYIGKNIIQGQNDNFINSLGASERCKDSDYLERGVYANYINGVIGLIIIRPNNEIRCVDVPIELQINICNTVDFLDSDGNIVTYRYINGKKVQIQKEKQKVMK